MPNGNVTAEEALYVKSDELRKEVEELKVRVARLEKAHGMPFSYKQMGGGEKDDSRSKGSK